MVHKDLEARRKYHREWRAARRAEYMADKSCVTCGSTENLEIDHIDPKQKISHNIWSWQEDRRMAELEKCQVLCRSCHRIRSNEQIPKTDHGRGQMYQGHGCRCDKCKAWKLAESRRYNAVTRARKIAREA